MKGLVASIVCILLFTLMNTFHPDQTLASDYWVRDSAGVIVDTGGEYTGATSSYSIKLTEGALTGKRYSRDTSYGEYYNVNSAITFDSPPVEIPAGATIQLKANGESGGYQNCCYIGVWFKYQGTCFSQTPSDNKVSLDLRTLPQKKINIPGVTDSVDGWQGIVNDDISVPLTMGYYGSSCTVQGLGTEGAYIKWTYTLQEREDLPSISLSFNRLASVIYEDDVVGVLKLKYNLSIKNTGNVHDDGILRLDSTLENYVFATPKSKSFYYTLAPQASAVYYIEIYVTHLFPQVGKIKAHCESEQHNYTSETQYIWERLYMPRTGVGVLNLLLDKIK